MKPTVRPESGSRKSSLNAIGCGIILFIFRAAWQKSDLGDKNQFAAPIVEFLKQLLAALRGKLLIIWDNALIDDCEKTRRFLDTDTSAKRLDLAKQPTYSPQLNADEQVWGQIKSIGLKNTCYGNVKELKPKLIEEMEKLKKSRN